MMRVKNWPKGWFRALYYIISIIYLINSIKILKNLMSIYKNKYLSKNYNLF